MDCLCKTLAGDKILLSKTCFTDLWFFKDLETKELNALNKISTRKKYVTGESVFLQGDPTNEIFLIKAGRIKLSKVMENGSEIILDFRKAGDTVGENMFSEEIDYPVSAWCMEETLICGLKRGSFEKIVMEYPRISLQIIKNMSNRISKLTSRLGSMTATTLEDRLYNVLLNVAHEHGRETPEGAAIRFPLTHEDLSFLVGAHRVSVTKAMKELTGSGKIVTQGKTILLPGLA